MSRSTLKTVRIDAPPDKVFEVVPASLALFAISIAGNSLFIYCRDRLNSPPRSAS